MMKLLLITVLFVSYLFANKIDITKKAITVGTTKTLVNAKIIAQKIKQWDVYIYKTTTTIEPLYVIYAVNILQNKTDSILKKIQEFYSSAYLTSNYRIKSLHNNHFEDNIFIDKFQKKVKPIAKIKQVNSGNKLKVIADKKDTTYVVKQLLKATSDANSSNVSKPIKPIKKSIILKVQKPLKVIPKKQTKRYGRIISFELIKEEYTISDNTNKVNGLGLILGEEKENYRKFINFKVTDGLNILGAYEYLFRLKDKNFLFAGLDAGYGIYLTPYTKDYEKGFIYGVSYGMKFSNYEIGMQNLMSNMKVTTVTNSYELNKINLLYFRYRF